ncbi:MAG: hypothetical protein RR923_00910, partial [Bacilli bacterium]
YKRINMEKVKKNLETIILLMIIFLMFVVLVIFYENKIKTTETKTFYNNKNEYLTVEVKFVEQIKEDLVSVKGNYLNYVSLDPSIIKKLKNNKTYQFKFKTNNKKVEKGNLTKLFQTYEIIEINIGVKYAEVNQIID